MSSTPRIATAGVALGILFGSSVASAQINFIKEGYYLSLGDSIGAGEGALPVTQGFVYRLYEQGVFGRKQVMDFSNIAIKGVTADEVQFFQVPEALCVQEPRIAVNPSVITLTAGSNDFLVYLAGHIPPNPPPNPADIPPLADAIAAKVENVIRALVFGRPDLPGPICQGSGIPGIKVLVSNYYGFNHPDPQIEFLLDLALRSFGASLSARVAHIQSDITATHKTARVGYVDTFSAMEGRQGLLLIEKRNGFTGGFDFEIHPTNAGHAVIAREFERVWNTMR
jgi:lysophospholipase L1-like esterase